MKRRFTLSHDVEGTLVISPPDGWDKSNILFERHPDFFCVRQRVDLPVDFYGKNALRSIDGGREFFLKVERNHGPDAVVGYKDEISKNGVIWTTIAEMEVPISGAYSQEVGTDNRIKGTPSDSSFWAKFISRFESPVDINSALNLDGTSADVFDPIDLKLTSQIINKTSNFDGHSGDEDTLEKCNIATTANITLSGHQIVDGVLTTEGMRVFVKDQTAGEDNGPYLASSGAWSRTADANTGAELEHAIVSITQGTVNSGKVFRVNEGSITLGTTPITVDEYNYVDHYLLNATTVHPDDYPDPYEFYTPLTVNKQKEEINRTNELPFIADEVNVPSETIESISDRGVLTLDGSIDLSFDLDAVVSSSVTATSRRLWVRWFVKLNDDAPILIDQYDVTASIPISPADPQYFTLTGTQDLNIVPGDRVTSYLHWYLKFNGGIGHFVSRDIYGGVVNEDVEFKLKSTFPDTQIKAEFIHDLFGKVCDRITGVNQSFYSELLGAILTKYRGYDADGIYSQYASAKGLHIRGFSLTEKPFFTTGREVWNGINPILNLFLAEKTIDGQKVIYVGKKAEAFPDRVSVRLSNVHKIRRYYDADYQYNGIDNGYEKWESKDVSGLDDPQSKRSWNSVFKKIGKRFINRSLMIAASLLWEQARRTVKTQSADYEYDNDTFIVNIISSPTGVYQPVLDENFSSVTNLTNEETRYNKVLTCARNFLRWIDFYSGCLQAYISSSFTFAGGEGNYDMVSTMADNGDVESNGGSSISEKADIPVSSNYLFLPMPYEIEDHDLTFSQIQAIIADPEAAIEVSQTKANYKKFFIKTLKVNPSDGSMSATLWPKEYMELIVVAKKGNIFSDEFSDEFA